MIKVDPYSFQPNELINENQVYEKYLWFLSPFPKLFDSFHFFFFLIPDLFNIAINDDVSESIRLSDQSDLRLNKLVRVRKYKCDYCLHYTQKIRVYERKLW